MKKYLGIIISIICVSVNLHADQYIVTNEGKATWAVGTTKKGDSIVYTEKSTGNEVTVPISDLDGVIPKVKRGKKYSEEYIQKQIAKLKKLRTKHRKKILRPLNQLLQEWEMLLKPSEEIETGIPRFESVFMGSPKDTADFKKAHMGLGMLKYKDMRGAYTQKIDDALKRVQDAYVVASMSRLASWSKNTKLELAQFHVAKKLHAEAVQYVDGATKTKATALFEQARVNTTKHLAQSAGVHFAKNKNVDGYLHGYDMLRKIKDEVAETEVDQEAAVKRMDDYRGKVARYLSAYTIDEKGFPIPKKEASLMSDFKQYGSAYVYTSDTFVEQAVFVPAKNPGAIRVNSMGTPIKFRIFFNHPQPAGRDYGVRVSINGTEYSKSQVFTFTDPIKVTNGNADLTFQCQFSWLPDDFVPGDPETGRKYVSVSLGYKPENAGWKPMSNVCRFTAN
ncbi:hypothetical protein BVX94_03775 [bacterium B17]|nr:hypothetical protein BVX94_03775 [bacterium B17]